MMNGLIHHLDDSSVIKLLKRVKLLLKPSGQVITLDGCYIAGQSILARKMLDYDRGKYIRNALMFMAYTFIIMKILRT